MYYSAAYVNIINSDYKLWSTVFLRSWLSLSSSGTFTAFMEFESSLLYLENFSICVYPAPDKSCEHLHTCFFKISLNTVMPPKMITPSKRFSNHWKFQWNLCTYLLQPHAGCIIYVFHPTFFIIVSDKKHTLQRSSICSFLKLGVAAYTLGLRILHGTMSANILTLDLYTLM